MKDKLYADDAGRRGFNFLQNEAVVRTFSSEGKNKTSPLLLLLHSNEDECTQ